MVFNKVAFFSVVFPANLPYIEDFLASLARQSYKKFDFYFVNDSVEDFFRYTRKHGLNCFEIRMTGTPAKTREAGINQLYGHGYECIVFGDSDDFFERSRIEKSLDLLSGHDIAVNELDIVSSSGELIRGGYLSEKIGGGRAVGLENIRDKNIFGLSNTAIRVADREKIVLSDDLIAVDWYFFSYYLMKGYSAVFTDETRTFYRQHGLNTAGICVPTKETVIRGINAKYYHYRQMAKLSGEFYPYLEKFRDLKNTVENSGEEFVDGYVDMVRKNSGPGMLWWENIKCIEELR